MTAAVATRPGAARRARPCASAGAHAARSGRGARHIAVRRTAAGPPRAGARCPASLLTGLGLQAADGRRLVQAALFLLVVPSTHEQQLRLSVECSPGLRDGYAPAGFVIDRLSRFEQRESNEVVSIDELAIVLARDSLHRIDSQLCWRLWATDLCLEAITRHKTGDCGAALATTRDGCEPDLPAAGSETPHKLVQLAQVLGREPGTLRRGAPGVPLIIATELYESAG